MAKVDHDDDMDVDDNDDDDNDYIDLAPRFWGNVAKVRPIYFPRISEQI